MLNSKAERDTQLEETKTSELSSFSSGNDDECDLGEDAENLRVVSESIWTKADDMTGVAMEEGAEAQMLWADRITTE